MGGRVHPHTHASLGKMALGASVGPMKKSCQDLEKNPIKNILQDLAKTFQDLASWQEICSKSMPTFRTCKNLSYLARFLFQIHAKILYCLISGQILARS